MENLIMEFSFLLCLVFGAFLSKVSSKDSLQIDEKQEELILNNSKLLKKPVKLGDLKSIFEKKDFQSKAKVTRKNYRDSIEKFVESEEIAKKLESGNMTIAELEKICDKVTTFGNLKKLVVFGIKDSGENINPTFLYFQPIESKKTK